NDFSQQLGEDVTIMNIIPDSIVFNFSDQVSRKVAVKPEMKISFEKQYDSTGSYSVKPDSVFVSGAASAVNKIKYISTELISFQNLKEPVSKKVKLVTDKLLSLSDSIVKVDLPVEKFTEANLEVPLIVSHVPSGYSLKTFPEKINIKM